LAEHQRDGLHIASQIMQLIEQPEDLAFAHDVISMSGLNTSWYSYAEHSPVMRRRLNLPLLADEETEWHETKNGLLTKAQQGLVEVATVADALASAKTERRSTARHQQLLGRQLGNVSLQLACIEVGSVAKSYSPFDIQNMAREQSLHTLEKARVFGDHVGSNPSLAQLADPNSDLAVYWRRNAPNGAFEAYEEALEDYPRTI
jgi:hypothetical protein